MSQAVTYCDCANMVCLLRMLCLLCLAGSTPTCILPPA